MNVTQRYPEKKKRRRHLWMTRRLTFAEVARLLVPRRVFPTNEEGQVVTNRCLGEVNTIKLIRDFYRFNTKPNWTAHAAALKGAHLAILEAERR